MTEESNENDPIVLLKKIQQHLTFLEKKIDTLIEKSQQAPQGGGNSFRGNSFSRPPRPFSHPHGAGRGKHPHRPGSGGESRGRDSFPRSFDGPPRRREGQDQGQGQGQGFFKKKKPFFRRDRG